MPIPVQLTGHVEKKLVLYISHVSGGVRTAGCLDQTLKVQTRSTAQSHPDQVRQVEAERLGE